MRFPLLIAAACACLLAAAGGVWWAVSLGGADEEADDRVAGRLLWELEIGEGATDVVVHEVVDGFALIGVRGEAGSSRGRAEVLYTVAMGTGEVAWQVDRQGSVAEPPLRVHTGTVVHAVGADASGVVGRDLATGEERWTRSGRLMAGLDAGFVVFDFSADTVELVDASGTTKWTIAADTIHGVASDALFAIRRSGPDAELMGYDIGDGTELWSEPYRVDPDTYGIVRDAMVDSEPAGIVATMDGGDLAALDAGTGGERWRRPIDATSGALEVVVDREAETIFECVRGVDALVVRAVEPATGRLRWEQSMPPGSGVAGYDLRAIAFSDQLEDSNRCFGLGLPGSGSVSVFDLSSGNPIWTHAGDGRPGQFGFVAASRVEADGRARPALVVDFADRAYRDLATGEVVAEGDRGTSVTVAGQTTIVRRIDEGSRLVSFATLDGSWEIGGYELLPLTPDVFYADGVMFAVAGDRLVAVD